MDCVAPWSSFNRAHGFRFVIYTFDHEPAHVHVTRPGQAKINPPVVSGTPEIVFSAGIKRADMRRLLAKTITYRDAFLQE